MTRKFPIPPWLAAVLGGFTYLLLHLIIELVFPDHWAGSSTRLLSISYAGWSRLLWLPITLLLLGLMGIYHHLVHVLGRLGKIGYWLAAVGFALEILGSVIEFWIYGLFLVPFVGEFTTGSAGSQLGYETASYGSMLGIVGLVLFGIACLCASLPKPWDVLPLLISLVALSIFYFFFADQLAIHAALYGVIWMAVGYFLWSSHELKHTNRHENG
jgi:hypothetical protein